MEYIGKGIYTYSEVSKITGINSNTIRRWIEGYSGTKAYRDRPPLFPSDYEKIENKKALSFMDLIEILFIKSFKRYGLSIQLIRKAVERASIILSTSHPFAQKIFYTDGKTILARIAEDDNIPELIDLIRKQYQFDSIVLPDLYKCIDFDHYDIAERYWPEGKDTNIIIDPKINMGKPSLYGPNIPIQTIQQLLGTGQSIEEIADWYDVEKNLVELVKQYENRNVA